MEILVVDGYNIIGAWDDLNRLKKNDIAQARNKLLDILSEYQAFTGNKVIIVFDALYVKGTESRKSENNVEVIYTKEDETADECIEKLVKSLKNVKNQVYVATSDYMEQRTIFSRGALRISARELLLEVNSMDTDIHEQLQIQEQARPKQKIPIQEHILAKFEKWRRGHS